MLKSIHKQIKTFIIMVRYYIFNSDEIMKFKNIKLKYKYDRYY